MESSPRQRRQSSFPAMVSQPPKRPLVRRVKTVDRIQNFRDFHGNEGAERFAQEVAAHKLQIRKIERFTKFVLHPGKRNSCLQWWDLVTAAALLYTIIFTPFEAGFLPARIGLAAWRDPWFIANRCLDCIFLFDMCLQFFIAYQSVDALGGLVWVEDQRRIVRNYLGSWFVLDALTIFVPGGFDLSLASDDASSGDFYSDISILRTLRVVRLAKLVRLVRASRLYRRWQSKVPL